MFRKETGTVRAVLDDRLGTRGRSVVLFNHRSSPAPEATINSIRQVLRAIGRQTDPLLFFGELFRLLFQDLERFPSSVLRSSLLGAALTDLGVCFVP